MMFDLDYTNMMQLNKELTNELVQTVFHPDRVNRMANEYKMDFDEYLDTI